jgi:hypothetical protein
MVARRQALPYQSQSQLAPPPYRLPLTEGNCRQTGQRASRRFCRSGAILWVTEELKEESPLATPHIPMLSGLLASSTLFTQQILSWVGFWWTKACRNKVSKSKY